MTYPDKFNQFWKLWPGRWRQDSDKIYKVGRDLAFQRWKRLSQETRNFLLELMKSGRVKDAGTQFLPDCWRWLRDKKWADFE